VTDELIAGTPLPLFVADNGSGGGGGGRNGIVTRQLLLILRPIPAFGLPSTAESALCCPSDAVDLSLLLTIPPPFLLLLVIHGGERMLPPSPPPLSQSAY
jgi:hypothetical protein